ncbi:MAG: hypothetical protein M3X11_04040 [Acidobacteriota bacterium]|nr:hypothetical protein [Acidobacteriota bacterium]
MAKLKSKNIGRFVKAVLVAGAICAACLLFISGKSSSAQQPQFSPNPPATSARYVGNAACAQCHQSKARTHAASSMAQALFPASDCQILQANPQLKFRNGAWQYEIKRVGNRSIYTVTDGTNSFSTPILWCFGRGQSGQTYLIEREGIQYETRVSFFTELRALDFTPGAPRNVPASLGEAIGQRLSQPDALSCFGCHATVAPGAPRFQLEKFTPGIGCETCHGPGEKHVTAMKPAQTTEVADKAIFNPRSMHPDDLSQQLCGACHRSWETVMQMPERGGISNVRFQPYRIANSRCYKNPDDRRISCTACHDPHEDPKHEAAFYDTKCTACHQTKNTPATKDRTAPPCPTGKAQCASCHMPKVEAPGLHFKFTDHHIRVVKPGEPYPN